MGWDAFGKMPRTQGSLRIESKELRWAFRGAAAYIRQKTGTVDALLRDGGLNVSTSGRMLEQATGESVYARDWTPEDVVHYHKQANWDFEYEASNEWAYESAKKFLAICAVFKIGIEFSW